MPRLSLYRPERGNDFRFLDRVIQEQFQVGGVDVFVHRYMGPVDPATGEATPGVPMQSNVIPELGIQDVILMENRDRKYDPDVYIMRGIYTMQDTDFNLSQFGIFLNNDNIMIHFHLSSCVEVLSRKLMSGDVLELPHLTNNYALDDATVLLKKFYVVQDVIQPSNGYSQTWYPHLIRAKCIPLVDSQEYSQILDKASGDGVKTLRDIMSTFNKNIEINNAIIAQAELDAPQSGFDTSNLFVVVDETVEGDIDASNEAVDITSDYDASFTLTSPESDYYVGYLTGDGIPPNGAKYTFGISFPYNASEGQFHLRTDYFPNVLFRFNGVNWMQFERDVRMTMTNTHSTTTNSITIPQDNIGSRQTQRTSFINNNNTATIANKIVPERQALSKALRPKPDN